jgi:uncharacterized membrane protein YgdD (TMEM256/DUF423 family)
MERVIATAGALSAFTAVAAGAFGAHALRMRLSAEMLAIFEVAARYQMYHALALIACAWVAARWPGTLVMASAWLFIIGSVLFCGSLYILSLTGLRCLGAVTPLGGIALLAGWLALGAAVWKS